jgi:hypothetical protein
MLRPGGPGEGEGRRLSHTRLPPPPDTRTHPTKRSCTLLQQLCLAVLQVLCSSLTLRILGCRRSMLHIWPWAD